MKKLKTKKGFTLIEVMVSITIFTLVLVSATGLFTSSIKAQRMVLAERVILDESSYVMEYMGRAIRMAKKELEAPTCLSANGYNYEETRDGKGIKFKNYKEECQEFFWDDTTNRLKEIKGGEEYFLTSANLEVISFNINLIGESQWDNNQPKATLFLKIKGTGEKAEQQPEISIQTTISQRDLDIRK
ncbi:MAG: type II secretion system protein [Candidatus Nealsonbacteria bacterium]